MVYSLQLVAVIIKIYPVRWGGMDHRGEATDVVVYLAANAKLLGILKRPRKPVHRLHDNF
jgi:hypothetical protein